jgi:hypothetical protein
MKFPNAAHESGPIARRLFNAHRRVMNDQVRDRRIAQTPMRCGRAIGTFPFGSRRDRGLRVFRLILFTHLYSIDVLPKSWL